jgi:tetratricopeptide (TPR) repeat protein
VKLLATAAVVIAITTGVAYADGDREGAHEAFVAGQKLYRAGNYKAAAAQFALAHDMDPSDPVYTFNLGQAHRMAGNCADAAKAFRAFLVEAPAAPNKVDVEKYIAEMDACGAKSPPPPDVKQPPPTPMMPPPPRPKFRTLAYGLLFGGAAVAAAGAYFTYDTHAAQNETDALCRNQVWSCDQQLEDLHARGNRSRTLAIVGLSAGGAALAAGVTLYLIGRASERERAVAVVPTSGGLVVTTALSF